MKNLGKANVVVELLDTLPNIDRDNTRYNFDVSSSQWDVMQKSPFFPPFLTEQIADPEGTFAALLPSRRIYDVNNFLQYADGTNFAGDTLQPYIVWTPSNILNKDDQGIITDIFNTTISDSNPVPYDNYGLLEPQNYSDGNYPTDYIGPKWEDAKYPKVAPTNDIRVIKNFLGFLGLPSDVVGTWVVPVDPPSWDWTNYVNQRVVRDGLAWAADSSPFLEENMPFWVHLKIARTPPSANHETLFIISLGLDDPTGQQQYDIFLSLNTKPKIFDYYQGRAAASGGDLSSGAATIIKEFDVDLSRTLSTQEDIEIGVMTIAGRLIVSVNQVNLIYNRVDKTPGDASGTFKECKIAPGRIRVCGTNVQAIFNAGPMTFAPLAMVACPIPTYVQDSQSSVPSSSPDAPPPPPSYLLINYEGVHYDGTTGGSVAILPQPPSVKKVLYGVDCYEFRDQTGRVFPDGLGFHQDGFISFRPSSSIGITALPSSDFYVITMRSYDTSFVTDGKPFLIPYGGCPYFFRLKGMYIKPSVVPQQLPEEIPEVISVTETSSSPDYFHAVTTASIVIYNENNKYDYLKGKQYGVRIKWGWGSNIKQTFTGVITGVTSSETPGKETLTLQCEDYMFILKNTFIVNSPFYDGMVAFYAIQDIAKRGGCTSIANDMTDPNEYFLPAGYTFSKPVMRFPSNNTLFNCLMDIVKRFEAFVYFDPLGGFHVNKLPGGLFSAPTSFVASFVRNPDAADASLVILNEKNIEYSYASTVNRISILTLDRDTRNAIVLTHSATPAQDHLLYKRVLLLNQPAYGELEVARTYAKRLGMRIFWPIRKTSFATIGGTLTTIANVLDFVKVDQDEYRVLSIARKYSADSNDFMIEYGTEWLGGA